MELLKPTGGKIHVFMSSLPNCGTKALKLRDGQSNVSDKEKQTGLLPQDMTYLTLAAQAADFNVRLFQEIQNPMLHCLVLLCFASES